MKSIYYSQIVELLTDRPEGLKASTIAVHIFNQRGNLFDEGPDFNKLYESVRQYLWQHSKKKSSPFEQVENKRGYYRLRHNINQRMTFNFLEEEEKPLRACEDDNSAIQLSFFDQLDK